MVWCSGWRLASAVSNNGGLGLLGAGSMHCDTLTEHIRKMKEATDRPWGVNVPLLYPEIDKLMGILADEQVKIVFTSAGSPKKWTSFLKSHGMTVVHVVSSASFAQKCEEAGCDAIVAEGGTMLALKKIAPTRLIKNEFYEQVKTLEDQGADSDTLKELLGKGRAKQGIFEGNLAEGELEIGQIASMLKGEESVAEIMQDLLRDYNQSINRCSNSVSF